MGGGIKNSVKLHWELKIWPRLYFVISGQYDKINPSVWHKEQKYIFSNKLFKKKKFFPKFCWSKNVCRKKFWPKKQFIQKLLFDVKRMLVPWNVLKNYYQFVFCLQYFGPGFFFDKKSFGPKNYVVWKNVSNKNVGIKTVLSSNLDIRQKICVIYMVRFRAREQFMASTEKKNIL